ARPPRERDSVASPRLFAMTAWFFAPSPLQSLCKEPTALEPRAVLQGAHRAYSVIRDAHGPLAPTSPTIPAKKTKVSGCQDPLPERLGRPIKGPDTFFRFRISGEGFGNLGLIPNADHLIMT